MFHLRDAPLPTGAIKLSWKFNLEVYVTVALFAMVTPVDLLINDVGVHDGTVHQEPKQVSPPLLWVASYIVLHTQSVMSIHSTHVLVVGIGICWLSELENNWTMACRCFFYGVRLGECRQMVHKLLIFPDGDCKVGPSLLKNHEVTTDPNFPLVSSVLLGIPSYLYERCHSHRVHAEVNLAWGGCQWKSYQSRSADVNHGGCLLVGKQHGVQGHSGCCSHTVQGTHQIWRGFAAHATFDRFVGNPLLERKLACIRNHCLINCHLSPKRVSFKECLSYMVDDRSNLEQSVIVWVAPCRLCLTIWRFWNRLQTITSWIPRLLINLFLDQYIVAAGRWLTPIKMFIPTNARSSNKVVSIHLGSTSSFYSICQRA